MTYGYAFAKPQMPCVGGQFEHFDRAHLIRCIPDIALHFFPEFLQHGGFQATCRLLVKYYIASISLLLALPFPGFKYTEPTGSKFLILPLHRSGCRAFAA